MSKKDEIILVVKQVDHNPDDIVSTFYETKEEFTNMTKGDKVLKSLSVKRPDSKKMELLENSDIDIETWIDEEVEKNISNNLIFSVVKMQLKKGYKINDFELFEETFKNTKFYVAFSNTGLGSDDYGLGDTEKYVEDNTSTNGLSENVKRDGCDIADNGKLVKHKIIYKNKIKKLLKTKSNNIVVKSSKSLHP